MYKQIQTLSLALLIAIVSLPVQAQIRINEVSHGTVEYQGSTNWVELYNAGSAPVDVSSWFLCDFPSYPQISSLNVLSGDRNIPAGGYLVLSWSDLDNDAEVGLYTASGFGNADNVEDYMQYGSAGHQREGVAVQANVWTAGEFVALATGEQTLQFKDNGIAGSGNWVSAAATPGASNDEVAAAPSIRINEVSHGTVEYQGSTNWVELYNAGTDAVDISGWFLCDFPSYPGVSTLNILSGELTIPAGGYLVLDWSDLDDDAEVGLYTAAGFGSADNMEDYMQYGSAGHQREGVAVTAGVWTAGEFVALAAASQTLQFMDNGTVGSGNWMAAAATPGASNEEVAAVGAVRINEVSHGTLMYEGSMNWVELYNAGSAAVDVSGWFLCDFPSYPGISTLNILSGELNIPAGGYLVLDWSDLDDDAEVGLYTAAGFGDANNMEDYMQYGSAGHQREGVAVTAGVWTAGEFVALATGSETLQFFDNAAIGSGNWASSAGTPGAANAVATSNEVLDVVTKDFRLMGNYPNPFNPSTRIAFELSSPGEVSLAVYNVLGRKVADLIQGAYPAGSFEAVWNGQDNRGQTVPSGTYLYRLSFGNGQSQSRIMTLLK